jgi:protein-S-isoprenylcysteine O-methyltransferase Ste14
MSWQDQRNPTIAAQIGWKPILQFIVFVILLPLVLFAAAGRLNWGMGWTYVGVHMAFAAVSRLIVFRRNPDLLVERARSLQAEGAKGWDRWLMVVVGLLGPLAIWIVVGLDERFGWSPEIWLGYQLVALALVVAGYAVGTWAMAVNAYFSGVVRIQKERGQTVVKAGPYRVVRHPAYAGAVVTYLAMPVMLDSLWGLVPAGLTVVALWIRTALEDRTLKEELPGYEEYVRETKYRLIPGLW